MKDARELAGALVELVRGLVREEIAAHAPTQPRAAGDVLTVAQAAERIAMSQAFVRGAIADERLPSHKVGRAVRVRAADVDALLETKPRRAADSPRARAARVSIGDGQ